MFNDPWLLLSSGAAMPAPAARRIRGMASSGTNITGGALYLDGGAGTGVAAGGSVFLRTTPPGSSGALPNLPLNTLGFDGSGLLQLTSTTQFAGYVLCNATSGVASLFGAGTGNTNGTLQLSTASGVAVQLSAAGQSYLSGPLFFGNGVTSTAPAASTVAATGGSGANIAGASLNIAGGAGTGTGAGGDIILQTAPASGSSGATLNAEFEQFRVLNTGGVRVSQSGAKLLEVTGANGTVVTATAQFTGLSVRNATNPLLAVFGTSGTNDNAALQLFAGGVNTVSITSYGQTFFNGPIYIGNGVSNVAPAGQFLLATQGSGTNIAGAAMNIGGGAGTGTGIGGSINFYTAPAGTTGTTVNSAVPRLVIDGAGLCTFGNNATVRINGNVGFYNTAPVAKPTVSGAKGSNAALASLMTALAALGLVTDTTTT